MKLSGKRILVTGGTGFVGSHLVEALLEKKAEVVSTYLTENPRSYFQYKKLAEKTILVRSDLTDFSAVADLVSKLGIEFIFHLAAQPLVDVAYMHPRQTIVNNIVSTANIMEAARIFPQVRGVVVASSDKSYGKLAAGKKYRETDALRGDHPYEMSKSATDLLTNAYIHTYHVPAVITRFGNIYGAGDLNFSRIIPGIMRSAVTGETLMLRSNGKFVRDYLHVDDVVDGYLALAAKIEKKNVRGEAFNFGSPDTYSVIDVIRIAEDVLKKKISFTITNTAQNEIPYQSLNAQKIQETVGWKPQRRLKKVLPEIFAYYQEIL